jgi:molybdopterin molybdotransferase
MMPNFLKFIPLSEAQSRYWKEIPIFQPKIETIPVLQSLGRILAVSVVSKVYLPPFSRSSMDGYAVKASDTKGAAGNSPIELRLIGEVPMGAAADFSLQQGEAAAIHTGGMLPSGADAVVILEDCKPPKDGHVVIQNSVKKDENVLLKGEDVKPGDLLLERGQRIRVEEVAGLQALGMTEVDVFNAPRIAVLSSGDEIVPPGQDLQPGQVYDVNTGALSAFIQKNGGIPVRYAVFKDDPLMFDATSKRAFNETDAIVFTAGSSASSRDITAETIQKLGKPGVIVHGIAVRPGKPTILALCDGKPVIGLPGNPVSALVIARLFLAPLIRRLAGQTQEEIEPVIQGVLLKSIPSTPAKDEFFPVVLKKVEGQVQVEPIFFKSNFIFNLAKAQGLVLVPAGTDQIEAGYKVDIILLV